VVSLALGFEVKFLYINGHESSSVKSLLDVIDATGQIQVNQQICHLDRKPSKTLSSYAERIPAHLVRGTLIVLLPSKTEKSEVQSTIQVLSELVKFKNEVKFQCYPYGNASFLLALSNIEREIKQEDCWILAIHPAHSQREINLNSDAVILAKAFATDTGLECLPVRVDLASSANKCAINKVVSQLSFRSRSVFSSLSLSLDEDEPPWLNSIQNLSPWVSEVTNYEFLDAKLGPLGPCSGLLKAIDVFDKQAEDPKEDFHHLQFDIEPEGYAVGTTYTWINGLKNV
jgi:hypothetical protein